MLANRFRLFSLMVLSIALVGLGDAQAGKKHATAKADAVTDASPGKKKAKAKPEVLTLKISNLTAETAPADVKKLEKAVKKVGGVVRSAVSKKKGEITVWHTKVATADAITTAVEGAGFTVVDDDAGDAGHE
ncbi:MAG: heavy metal-associated domain-containing protein [Myxococcota bacterium]